MPRLNERSSNRVPTFLSLPPETRAKLEAAIDHDKIKTLTDAVVAAADALEEKIKRRQARKPAAKPPQDPS